MDARLRPPWRPWEALPVALIALVGGVALTAVIVLVVGGPGGITLPLSSLGVGLLLFTVTVLWAAIGYRAVGALGLRSARPAKDAVVGASLGLVLYLAAVLVAGLVSVIWTLLTGSQPAPVDQGVVSSRPEIAEIVVAYLAVVLVAPLGEETFYRGFLYGSLRGRFGFWPAAAISGGLFALSHVYPILYAPLFVLGVVLAWLYERRGSLVTPMAAHAMFNLVGFTLIVMGRA